MELIGIVYIHSGFFSRTWIPVYSKKGDKVYYMKEGMETFRRSFTVTTAVKGLRKAHYIKLG